MFAIRDAHEDAAVYALIRCDLRLRCSSVAIVGGVSHGQELTPSALLVSTTELRERSDPPLPLVLRLPTLPWQTPEVFVFEPIVSRDEAMQRARTCSSTVARVRR